MDDQHISIDIHVLKLLEWLVSRRHCTHDWQADVVKIRAKINAAIQDMPENDEIVSLLSGTYINYFHCLKIVDILKQTEADSKNIFGSYSSKRMKDWQEIVKMYTKNNVYLAEAADLLINTVKYELPAIKKQIAKQNQMQNDFKKKQSDAQKSGQSAKNELSSLLKELGLDGQSAGYRESLIAKANELDSINNMVVEDMKKVVKAVEHYKSFTAFLSPNYKVDLALILYLAEKGNKTTYEWLNGVQPTKLVPPKLASEENAHAVGEDGIDWGYDAGDAEGIEIELVDSGDIQVVNEPANEVSKEKEIVAEGQLALPILSNASCRDTLVNQLLELRTFLKLRIYEAGKDGTLDTFVESKSALEDMLRHVENVLSLLTNPTTLHYFNILYSSKYLDDIVGKIEGKEEAIERYAAIAAMAVERIEEAAQEAVSLSQKAQTIVKKTKILQNEIAADVSQRYNGRNVFMTGGV